MSSLPDKNDTLPEPISLTIEQAMGVTSGLNAVQTAVTSLVNTVDHPVLTKGLPPAYWTALGQNFQAG